MRRYVTFLILLSAVLVGCSSTNGKPLPINEQKIWASQEQKPDWTVKDGRVQAYASVEVYRATEQRTLAVTIGDGPAWLFRLKAPARPKKYSYESDWQKPDGVEGAASGVGEGMEIKVAM
jgi:hypothetical protein